MTPRDPKRRLSVRELRELQQFGSPAMQAAARELLVVRQWIADREGWPLPSHLARTIEREFAAAAGEERVRVYEADEELG